MNVALSAVDVDMANKAAVVLLGLLLVAFVWWLANSALRERRTTRAEAWARMQTARAAVAAISTELDDDPQGEADTFPIPAPRDGRHHLGGVLFEGAVTVPMLLKRVAAEIDPPLMRPYMQDDFPTREIVVFRGEPPPVWKAPPAQPLPAWFRESKQQ